MSSQKPMPPLPCVPIYVFILKAINPESQRLAFFSLSPSRPSAYSSCWCGGGGGGGGREGGVEGGGLEEGLWGRGLVGMFMRFLIVCVCVCVWCSGFRNAT